MISSVVRQHNYRLVNRRAISRRKVGSASNRLILSRFWTLSGENHCIKDYVLIDKTTTRLLQSHTLENAVKPPVLGGFLFWVVWQREPDGCWNGNFVAFPWYSVTIEKLSLQNRAIVEMLGLSLKGKQQMVGLLSWVPHRISVWGEKMSAILLALTDIVL